MPVASTRSRKPRFKLGDDEPPAIPLQLQPPPDIILSSAENTTTAADKPEPSSSPSYPPTLTSSPPKESKTSSTPQASPPISKPKPKFKLPSFLLWIPPKLNWKGLRPVLRASVAAWCGLILVLDSKSEKMLGQASFLVLIVATIHPASIPIASMIEQSFFQILFVAGAWGWSCLALFLAHESRTLYRMSQSEFGAFSLIPYLNSTLPASEISTEISESIFHGKYLESGSSAICGIFLAVGGGFLLWLRGHWGPGPALFGIIFGIIMLSITLTIGCLFPYPFYSVGLVFFIPFICQQAIGLLVSILVFPETLSHQFCDRLISTLTPLRTVIQKQKAMLSANPRTSEWLEFKSIRQNVVEALAGLALMGTSEANLTREISFARVPGKDLSRILGWMRLLVSRSSGFVRFYDIVENHLHREYSDAKGGRVVDDLVIHLGHSRRSSAEHTPPSTRPTSPTPNHSTNNRNSNTEETGSRPHSRSNSPSGRHLNPLFSINNNSYEVGMVHHPSPLHPRPTTPPMDARGGAPLRNYSSGALINAFSSGDEEGDVEEEEEDERGELEEDSARVSRSIGDYNGHRPKSVTTLKKRPKSHHRSGSHSHYHHHGLHSTLGHLAKSASGISLPSLLHDVLHPNIDLRPVGVGESQRYMDLEDYLHNPRDEEHIEEIIGLLSLASSELLIACDNSIGHLINVIHRIKTSESIFPTNPATYEMSKKTSSKLTLELETAINYYRDTKRLDVVKPFASLFDPFAPRDRETFQSPSHRGLFWAFSLQFSLLAWSDSLLELCQGVTALEKKRRRMRVWTPEWAKWRWNRGDEEFDEEAPHNISGYKPNIQGFTRKEFNSARHPDYIPPETLWHVAGIKAYDITQLLTRADVLFGVKSAVLLGLISLPAFFSTTCHFFYTQRGVWVLIMAALTSTNYVGDTSFGFTVRVIGTLAGAIVGLVIWYIGAGSGRGNPYGLAAVAAVTFPFVFLVRVHFTPPVSAIFPCVTACLVIGYSWQDANQPALSSVGWGWDVAWKRFTCVLIGVTAAYIWALLPPKATQKETVRKTYARVIGEMGGVLCQVLSFANCKDQPCQTPKQIVANIAALRIKVGKTTASRAMIRYEISLRGAWPADYYASLQTLQMEILDLLGQLCAVVASLDDKWTKALMQRSQLSNPRFLGEVLNTFQLISTSLGNINPLPMIYNPLLELYLRPQEVLSHQHPYGYEVTLDHIDGIPQHVDLHTICSLEYLRFSCGISITYAIINRLDRLMFVSKSLLGESYIVYGLPEWHSNQTHLSEDNRQRWQGDISARNSTDDFGA